MIPEKNTVFWGGRCAFLRQGFFENALLRFKKTG